MPIPIVIAVTEQYLEDSNAAFKSATLWGYICQDFSSSIFLQHVFETMYKTVTKCHM